MIFKTLKLKNFGLYKGTKDIDFTINDIEKPVILIGGLNGRGKTTLMEAILLALYGKKSFAVTTSRLSYSDYLKKYISKENLSEGTFIELTFSLDIGQPDLTIRRSWEYSKQTVEDQFKVFQNGMEDIYLSENWLAYLESTLPTGVSKLFFFDGEKITQLANDQTDLELKESIRSLLGVDTIDRLLYDLDRIIDKQSSVELHETAFNELDELKNDYSNLEQELEEIQDSIVNENKELQQTKGYINDAEASIIKLGGGLSHNTNEIKTVQDSFEKELEQINERILDLAGKELPLLMLQDLLFDTQESVLKNQEQEQEEIGQQKIEDFTEKLLSFLEEENVDHRVISRIEYFKQSSRLSINKNEYQSFSISPNAQRQLEGLCGQYLKDLLREVNALIERRNQINAEVDKMASYLKHGEETEGAEKFLENMKEFVRQQTILQNRLQKLEQTEKELKSKLLQLSHEKRQLSQKILESEESKRNEARIVKYANYSIQVMEAYKIDLQTLKIKELNTKINDCFARLSAKSSLIGEIYIDPRSLDINIMNQNKEIFSKTVLSAGERQMLVVAILWGLSSCVESQLPVLIDTPLARLDSTHRENFIREYLPYAGKQVIVLSTDEEINGKYFEMLNPFISSKYLLYYDEDNDETLIYNGYFKKEG